MFKFHQLYHYIFHLNFEVLVISLNFNLSKINYPKYINLATFIIDFHLNLIFIEDLLFISNELYYSHIFDFMQFLILFKDILHFILTLSEFNIKLVHSNHYFKCLSLNL